MRECTELESRELKRGLRGVDGNLSVPFCVCMCVRVSEGPLLGATRGQWTKSSLNSLMWFACRSKASRSTKPGFSSHFPAFPSLSIFIRHPPLLSFAASVFSSLDYLSSKCIRFRLRQKCIHVLVVHVPAECSASLYMFLCLYVSVLSWGFLLALCR